MDERLIERYLDHAVLKPHYSRGEAEREIRVGLECNVRTVCVRPCDLDLAVALCAGTDTDPGVTLAFPHGCALSASKVDEARRYVELGAREIDMVANYGLIRSGAWEAVADDIRGVTEIARAAGVLVKVILETASLTGEEIARATRVAADAGADFVKTSTGFGEGGASEQAVRTMLDAAGGRIAVKASGGIRDVERAEMFIAMGCERLGVGSTTTPVLCGRADGEGGAEAY